jgi:hypothetical protein
MTIQPAEIDELAERQILRILGVMGPYSVNKLLEALEKGQVEGDVYNQIVEVDEDGDLVESERPYDETEYIFTDEKNGPIKFEEFQGCLLGWAGFLEHQHYDNIRSRLAEKYGTGDIAGPHWARDNRTGHAETFVKWIHAGDTPENDGYALAFKNLILDFQAGVKQPVPVQDDERLIESESEV